MSAVLDTPLTDATSAEADVPVLIVGGGPTGLLSAYMLSKLGGVSLSRSVKKRWEWKKSI
jgi:ribulose 1,5-bisphosphate synthetase/thiazole synthase